MNTNLLQNRSLQPLYFVEDHIEIDLTSPCQFTRTSNPVLVKQESYQWPNHGLLSLSRAIEAS